MKKVIEWEAVQNVAMGTSYGLMHQRVQRTMNYTIRIGDDKSWFEVYDEESGGEDFYSGGSLEFNGNRLTGFDGPSELPDEIVNKIVELGYIDAL